MDRNRLSRRRALTALSMASVGPLTGCSGVLPSSSDSTADEKPDEADDSKEATDTADPDESGTVSSDSVPMFRYDAANTGYRPDGRGPTGDGTEQWRVETGGSVRSSPAVADGTVYVASGDGTVYAIEADGGQVEWTADLRSYSWSSPAVVNDTVYVGDVSGAVTALATDDGSELWQSEATGPVVASPTVVDGSVFISTSEGAVLAIDANSGVEQWRRDLSGVTDASRRSRVPSGTRLASDVAGQRLQAGGQSSGGGLSTPAVGDTGLYVATDSALYELDEADGERRWSVQFSRSAVGRADATRRLVARGSTGRFDRLQYRYGTPSSPALVDGVLYVGQYPDTVAVDAGSGQILWRADAPSGTGATVRDPSARRLQTAGTFDSSPAVTADSVYVGGDRFVALDRQSGTVNWARSLSGPVRSSPAVVDSTVYVGTDGERVVGLDAESGSTVWRADAGSSVVSSPAVVGGVAYVGSLDGAVYAFR